MYKYKECLPVPPLSFVDDILAVGHCGSDSLKLNSIIQSKMATKKLELGKNKCFKIHVGKKQEKVCPKLNVHQDTMKTTSSEFCSETQCLSTAYFVVVKFCMGLS